MNVLGWIALGVLALVVWDKRTKTSAKVPSASIMLDQGIDPASATLVQLYLRQGTDPNVISAFASKLQAAGFVNSAAALRVKAMMLEATTSTVLQPQGGV